MSPNFSVKICDNNPSRWYISFKQVKQFSLGTIKHNLEKISYQTLASTPTVMVFRSDDVKLTWHSHGLLQVDFNDEQERLVHNVEAYIKELLTFAYPE
ncbi:MAG: hypothetical protein ACW97Z_01960 [Candidatus Hodarchaeales archaeon]